MRPPSAVMSVRTASMPTPRPASSVTSSVVVKPGVKIRLASSASVGVRVGRDQAVAAAARLDALQVEAVAVVADLDPHFVALLGQRDVDRADRILVLRAAHVGRLDAVHDGVAQQVLEGAGHAIEHAAIEFDRRALDVQAHLDGGFLGGLAHDAVQAFGQRVERHHAGAQQVFRQRARQARLGGHLVFGRLHRLRDGCAAPWPRR